MNLRISKRVLRVWWVFKSRIWLRPPFLIQSSGHNSVFAVESFSTLRCPWMQRARAANDTSQLLHHHNIYLSCFLCWIFCVQLLSSFSTCWEQPYTCGTCMSQLVAHKPSGRVRRTDVRHQPSWLLTRHYLEIKHCMIYTSSLCRRYCEGPEHKTFLPIVKWFWFVFHWQLWVKIQSTANQCLNTIIYNKHTSSWFFGFILLLSKSLFSGSSLLLCFLLMFCTNDRVNKWAV